MCLVSLVTPVSLVSLVCLVSPRVPITLSSFVTRTCGLVSLSHCLDFYITCLLSCLLSFSLTISLAGGSLSLSLSRSSNLPVSLLPSGTTTRTQRLPGDKLQFGQARQDLQLHPVSGSTYVSLSVPTLSIIMCVPTLSTAPYGVEHMGRAHGARSF